MYILGRLEGEGLDVKAAVPARLRMHTMGPKLNKRIVVSESSHAIGHALR